MAFVFAAQAVCSCEFCGGSFTARGIKNHERHCSENPHKGVHPDDHPDLFADAQDTHEAGESPQDANPHQESNAGGRLPERDTLPEAVKETGSGRETSDCPNCGGSDVIPADQAREKLSSLLDSVPGWVTEALGRAARYCNNCYSVSGGDLDDSVSLNGGGDR